MVGSALKFRRALLGANLQLIAQEKVSNHSRNLESVVSKNIHSVQYKQTLSCLFNNLYMDLNAAETALMSEGARDELLMLTLSLPIYALDEPEKPTEWACVCHGCIRGWRRSLSISRVSPESIPWHMKPWVWKEQVLIQCWWWNALPGSGSEV